MRVLTDHSDGNTIYHLIAEQQQNQSIHYSY